MSTKNENGVSIQVEGQIDLSKVKGMSKEELDSFLSKVAEEKVLSQYKRADRDLKPGSVRKSQNGKISPSESRDGALFAKTRKIDPRVRREPNNPTTPTKRPESSTGVSPTSSLLFASNRPSSAPSKKRSPSPSKKKPEVNFVDSLPQFGRAELDLSGFSIPEGEENLVTVENFNDNAQDLVITSPRSIESCLRQGVVPKDLIKRSYESFEEKGIDKDVQMERYKHHEQRRKEKTQAVREERQRIIEELRRGSAGKGPKSLAVGAAENERKKVERMLKTNESHLKQMLDYEEKLRRIAEDYGNKMEKQRKREEMEKLAQQRDAEMKERERIQRQKEHKEATERILQQQHEQLMKKQRELEEKEEKRKRILDQKREAQQKEHADQARRTRERIDAALEMQRRIKEEQRMNFDHKQNLVEERREQFEERRKKHNDEQKRKAEEKARKIARTQMRNALLEEEKKQRILNKQRRADELKRRQDQEMSEWLQQKRKLDTEKQNRRIQIHEQARKDEQDRINYFKQKQDQADENLRRLKEKQDHDFRVHLEQVRLKEQDRRDKVERMKRRKEWERVQTLEKIRQKEERVKMLEDTKKELIMERKRCSDYVNKNKKYFNHPGPGPGEYLGLTQIGDEAPKYKFGMSAEQLKPRVISHAHAKEWYGYWSPGPCAYNVDPKSNKPKWSFSKSNRFESKVSSEKKNLDTSPGPGDYTPSTSFASNSMPYEDLKLRSTLKAK